MCVQLPLPLFDFQTRVKHSISLTISSDLVCCALNTFFHVHSVDLGLTSLLVQFAILHVEILLGLANAFGQIPMDQAGVGVV